MNQTAIITGATSGIGRAAAERFAAEGYNLVVTGRRENRLSEVADHLIRRYGVRVRKLCFDVRSMEETLSAFGSLEGEWRSPRVLVNNAGLAAGLDFVNEGDVDDWERMIDTNIKGVLYVTRIVSGMMIDAGRGHIVNIGSIAGTQTYEKGNVYCASKHAMHALSQGMRIDLLKHGIRVTEIRPGMVETEFSLVRFHGDAAKAGNVYAGVTPLSGDDIAEAIWWVVSLPAHVNINDLEITPTQQANAFYTFRK